VNYHVSSACRLSSALKMLLSQPIRQVVPIYNVGNSRGWRKRMIVKPGDKRYGATDVRLTTFRVKQKEKERERERPRNHFEENLLHPRGVVFGSRQHASRGRVWAQMTRNKSNARRYTPPLLRTPFFSPYGAEAVLSAVAGGFPPGSEQSISGIRNALCSR